MIFFFKNKTKNKQKKKNKNKQKQCGHKQMHATCKKFITSLGLSIGDSGATSHYQFMLFCQGLCSSVVLR
jgi:hypothetical protein